MVLATCHNAMGRTSNGLAFLRREGRREGRKEGRREGEV